MKIPKFVGILLATTLALGTGVLTACGSADDATAGTAATSKPTTAEPAASVTPRTIEDIALSPGTAGPVTVGMSKTEATATGLFASDVANPTDGCDIHDLTWVTPFDGALDVQTLEDGSIASIGVRKAGPRTADGLGVGSTYADVLAAYPDARAVEAGYSQSGVLVHDDAHGWIGYLFNAQVKDLKGTDAVSFIELTKGEKPALMRDGC